MLPPLRTCRCRPGVSVARDLWQMLWVLHSPCPCHRCQVGAIALLDGNRHPRSFARMDPVLGCLKSKPPTHLGTPVMDGVLR